MKDKKITAEATDNSCQQKIADRSTVLPLADSGTYCDSVELKNAPTIRVLGAESETSANFEADLKMGFYQSIARGEKDEVICLEEFAGHIRSGEYRNKVAAVRSAETEEQRRVAKSDLPCVTGAGVFSGRRKKDQPLDYSGLVCLDFDAKDNPSMAGREDEMRDQLAQDEHVAFAFISVSGKGLAAFFRIDPERYQEAFDGLSAYVRELYGLIHDPDCHGDVTRLRLVSYDPGASYKPDAKVFDQYIQVDIAENAEGPDAQGSAQSKVVHMERAKLESALGVINPDERSVWLKVGMALRYWGAKNGCEQDAWQLFDEWSTATTASNYDQDQNLKTWNSFDVSGSRKERVTLGTIFHLAHANGWKFDSRSISSPGNGSKGGRPPSPPHADTAAALIAAKFTDDKSSLPTLRFRDGLWFLFTPDGWLNIPTARVLSEIATFMQNDPNLHEHCSSNYFRSVRDNLASFNLCATHHQMPIWLNTGASALHSIAFSDGVVVDILRLAKNHAGIAEDAESNYVRQVSPAFFSKSFVGYPMTALQTPALLFEQYLSQVLPDSDSRRMLQQMAGIALCDETRFEVFFAFIGSGANGKTVFLDVLQHLVGRQNVCFVPLNRIADRFQSFPLAEHKLNICGEMATDTGVGNLHMIEGVLKDCISGGDVEVERKGIDKTFAPCRARFIFSCNSMPTFVDRSDGIWRRLRVIKFPVTIPREERDVHLADKIIANELSAVMRWALQGLVDVVRDGHVFESEESLSLKKQHRDDCDKEKSFLMECCRLEMNAHVSKERLYGNYQRWCDQNGYRFPLAKKKFLRRVEEIFPRIGSVQMDEGCGSRARSYSGLMLTVNLL